jgi:malate synthase
MENAAPFPPVNDVDVFGPAVDGQEEVLTPDALAFVARLARKFGARRQELLGRRRDLQERLRAGDAPSFPAETAAIREGDWRVADIPRDLSDRRVEITGPVDRKMIINALNSGANVFMADFEDSNSPTWKNVVEGQRNLREAVAGTIAFTGEAGKEYRLGPRTATLMVRPRGWHLDEAHVRVDGEAVSASLFDFGVFFFHNARALVDRGTGPYFYLPKMESRFEARLWNDVFLFAQAELGLPAGTIRATVLIETILAAFEMDEILWELREHSAGLNCGRWDYIFSVIKKFSADASRVLPERGRLTMGRLFLKAYSERLVQICHRRGIHAMGGMAAQIPIKGDPVAHRRAIRKVTEDKVREVRAGHDGTWVAHPGLVAVAREVFDRGMPGPNQIGNPGVDETIAASDLLAVPNGPITEGGLAKNIEVAILYLESWLRGRGCVPIANLMEDAATAEICRAQVWQWLRHRALLVDGRVVDRALYEETRRRVVDGLGTALDGAGGAGRLEEAIALFDGLVTSPEFPDFLTEPAYAELLRIEKEEGSHGEGRTDARQRVGERTALAGHRAAV